MNPIVAAGLLICIVGLLIGVLLGAASVIFKIDVNPKEAAVRELLPGNNCGGCGFAGCDACAKAIADGKAPVAACPVGGAPVAKQIAGVMGVEAVLAEKKVAFVKCAGTCDVAHQKDLYFGERDCSKATVVPGMSDKACSFGCMGFGSCTKVCDFDAIHVINGVAVVDKEKCAACGKCLSVCPRHLIELVPYAAKETVSCASHAKGKDVRAVCDTGCIGCMLCTKQCESGAITVTDNLAHIDYEKCTGCGKCAVKCPAHVIRMH